jgi:hypothetical protein
MEHAWLLQVHGQSRLLAYARISRMVLAATVALLLLEPCWHDPWEKHYPCILSRCADPAHGSWAGHVLTTSHSIMHHPL